MSINIIRLSWLNLISNKLNSGLSILLMTFGMGIISLLLLINNEVEQQLQRNLRGIDMVVGAKGSPLQLILSAVYHVDNPTGNIPLHELSKLKKNPMVSKMIPLSFGDSYQGFRIVGTTHAYPELYEANLESGKLWQAPLEVVVGSKVAQVNNLNIGTSFYGAHGLVQGGEMHDEHPYHVVGILEQSNSVLDRLILTSTESIWEVHDYDEKESLENHEGDHDKKITSNNHSEDLKLKSDSLACMEKELDEAMITVMLVKFKSPVGLIQLPRSVNETTNMQAAVPVFEINRLINLMGLGLRTINTIALVIIIVSGLSIFIGLYNTLNKRRKELALIRVQGASRLQLVRLVLQEGLIITFLGVIFGMLLSRIVLWIVSIFFETNFSSGLLHFSLLKEEIWLFCITFFIGLLASIIPTIQTYYINIPKTLMDE